MEIIELVFTHLETSELLEDGKTKRDHLEHFSVDQLDGDPVFQETREMSHQFRDAVYGIFLRSSTELSRLTIEYGVFQ